MQVHLKRAEGRRQLLQAEAKQKLRGRFAREMATCLVVWRTSGGSLPAVLAALDSGTGAWAQVLMDVWKPAVVEFGSALAREHGAVVSGVSEAKGLSDWVYSPWSESTRGSVRKLVLDQTNRVLASTKHRVQKVLSDAANAGVEAGARALRALYAGFQSRRAWLMAENETVSAGNFGEAVAAADSGFLATKTWVTAGDERVRPRHRAREGVTLPVDQPFAPGLMYPRDPNAGAGEVVNCRCVCYYSE